MVIAYETDDPDPAGWRIRGDIAAHAYDQRKDRSSPPIANISRVAAEERWTGSTIRCSECEEFTAKIDFDEQMYIIVAMTIRGGASDR